MKFKITVAVAIIAVGFLLFVRCANMGTGTQTGNTKVAGVLHNTDGTRAAGAKVACIPRNHNPYDGSHSGGDSTTTDDTGAYKFKTMSADTYNILANTDTGFTYIDPIVVTSDVNTSVPPDTLKHSGSIQGIVELEPGDDARTVFMIFMGTNMVRMPSNVSGNFAVNSLGEGKYRVRLLTTLDNYEVMDTSFVIAAGRDSVLPQPIVMNYSGIPIPKNLQIQYDTMLQIVTLIWDTPTTGRPVGSYNVYRRNIDSNTVLARINSSPVTDTFYVDSTGMQDMTYEYQLAVVDTSASEGVKSMIDSVTIQPAFFIADTIFKVQGQAWVYAAEMDAQGNYVVVNGTAYQPTPASIERYSPSGTFINSWSIPGGVEESYFYDCIAVDDSNTIFVVTKDNKVIRYDTAGGILSQFQYPGTVRGIGLLRDTIYIVDRIAHIVRAYDIAGDSLFAWGSNGNGAGQFANIVALRTDTITKNIFVEDAYDYARIQIFDKNGNYKSSISFPSITQFGWGGQLEERNDTILICNLTIYGSTTNGLFVFKYDTRLVPTRAVFDKLTRDIILINRTGEVIRITRK